MRVEDDAWSLHKLDVKLVGMNWPDQSHLHFEIKEMSKPLEKTPRTRAQTQQEDTIDELCSVASSDAYSLCSDLDSATEEELEEHLCAEDGDTEGDSDTDPKAARAKQGTHTV